MSLFTRLHQCESIPDFISDNILEFIDYPNFPHSTLIQHKDVVDIFITERGEVLWELDYNNRDYETFVLTLYDICERFGLINTIRIAQIIEDKNITITSRLKAANLYLLNISSSKSLTERFEEICENLQHAVRHEEDDQFKINLTFTNYILYVIKNAHSRYKLELSVILKNHLAKESFDFLTSSNLIRSISELDFDNAVSESRIHRLIDAYILSLFKKPAFNPGYLVESTTEYAASLREVKLDFASIREISVQRYRAVSSYAIFSSLNHGVGVLMNENQLFAYMNSYGKMHYHKLMTAYQRLPDAVLNSDVSIIDWGCGQAVATIVYFEYLQNNNINQNINQVTLIDSSELALKRAALHVKSFNSSMRIFTIHKDLDSLSTEDLEITSDKINLHLFSNVLDIDGYLLFNLVQKIETIYKGINYFVCVSPNITPLKTNKIDSFMSYFQKRYKFRIFANYTDRANEWIGEWTRVVRVFESQIT